MPLLFFLPILILFVAPIVIGAILLFGLIEPERLSTKNIFKRNVKIPKEKGKILPTKTK